MKLNDFQISNIDQLFTIHNNFFIEVKDNKDDIINQTTIFNEAFTKSFLENKNIKFVSLNGVSNDYIMLDNIDDEDSFWRRSFDGYKKSIKFIFNEVENEKIVEKSIMVNSYYSGFEATIHYQYVGLNTTYLSGITLYSGRKNEQQQYEVDSVVSQSFIKDIEGDGCLIEITAGARITVHIRIHFGVIPIYGNESYNLPIPNNSSFSKEKLYNTYPINFFSAKHSALCGYYSYREYQKYSNLIPEGRLTSPVKMSLGLTKSLLPKIGNDNELANKTLNYSITSYNLIDEKLLKENYKNYQIKYYGLITGLVIPGIGVINLNNNNIGAGIKTLKRLKDKYIVKENGYCLKSNCLLPGSLIPYNELLGKPCYIPERYISDKGSPYLMDMYKSAFIKAEEKSKGIIVKKKFVNNGKIEINKETFEDEADLSTVIDKSIGRCISNSTHIPLTNKYGAGNSIIPCSQGGGNIFGDKGDCGIDIIFSGWQPGDTSSEIIKFNPTKIMLGVVSKFVAESQYWLVPSIKLEYSDDGNIFETAFDATNIDGNNAEPFTIYNISSGAHTFWRLSSLDSCTSLRTLESCGDKRIYDAMVEASGNQSINQHGYDPFYIFIWNGNEYPYILNNINNNSFNEEDLIKVEANTEKTYVLTKVPYLYKNTDILYFTGNMG